MSLFKVCPICRRCFYRQTEFIKLADNDSLIFVAEQEVLKDECPSNPESPTKKHTAVEYVSKKLPE